MRGKSHQSSHEFVTHTESETIVIGEIIVCNQYDRSCFNVFCVWVFPAPVTDNYCGECRKVTASNSFVCALHTRATALHSSPRLYLNENFCAKVRLTYPFNMTGFFLDFIDASILQYLVTNADRFIYQVYKGNAVAGKMMVMLDNGKR